MKPKSLRSHTAAIRYLGKIIVKRKISARQFVLDVASLGRRIPAEVMRPPIAIIHIQTLPLPMTFHILPLSVPKYIAPLVALLVLALVLTGCDSFTDTGSQQSTTSPTASRSQAAPADSSQVALSNQATANENNWSPESTNQIFSAAREQSPYKESELSLIGVLDKNRTADSASVVYAGTSFRDRYRFFREESGQWQRGKLIKSSSKNALTQSSSTTVTLGYTYSDTNFDNQSDTFHAEEIYISPEGDYSVYVDTPFEAKHKSYKYVDPGEFNVGEREYRTTFLHFQALNPSYGYGPLQYDEQAVSPFRDTTGSVVGAETVRMRIRVEDDTEASDLTAPTIPALVSPDDGERYESTSVGAAPLVGVIWNASSGSPPIKYKVQVSETASFSSLYEQKTTSGTATGIPIEEYDDGETFYWRVQAYNSDFPSELRSNWSETRSFTLDVVYEGIYGPESVGLNENVTWQEDLPPDIDPGYGYTWEYRLLCYNSNSIEPNDIPSPIGGGGDDDDDDGRGGNCENTGWTFGKTGRFFSRAFVYDTYANIDLRIVVDGEVLATKYVSITH